MTYILFTVRLRSHQGTALKSVLYWWLLSSSISKGLSALLQGNSLVAAKGEESVGHLHSQPRFLQLARNPTCRLSIHEPVTGLLPLSCPGNVTRNNSVRYVPMACHKGTKVSLTSSMGVVGQCFFFVFFFFLMSGKHKEELDSQ